MGWPPPLELKEGFIGNRQSRIPLRGDLKQKDAKEAKGDVIPLLSLRSFVPTTAGWRDDRASSRSSRADPLRRRAFAAFRCDRLLRGQVSPWPWVREGTFGQATVCGISPLQRNMIALGAHVSGRRQLLGCGPQRGGPPQELEQKDAKEGKRRCTSSLALCASVARIPERGPFASRSLAGILNRVVAVPRLSMRSPCRDPSPRRRDGREAR